MIQIRTTEEQEQKISQRAEENGFETVSAFIKYVALNAIVTATVPTVPKLGKNIKIGVRKDGSIEVTVNGEEIGKGKVKETLRQVAKENNIDIAKPEHRQKEFNTRELGNIILKELK